MLNGRFRGDSLGYFTFFKSNGTSTVDYMLVSGQLVHNIRLNVLPPNELSDHSLINTSIETNYNFLHREKYKTTPSPGKYLWNNESKTSYLNALLDNKEEQQISNLNELVD